VSKWPEGLAAGGVLCIARSAFVSGS
jgi:hypothetical protein